MGKYQVSVNAQGKGTQKGLPVGNYGISMDALHFGTQLYSDITGTTAITTQPITAQDGSFTYYVKGDGVVTVRLIDSATSTAVTDTTGIFVRRSNAATPTEYYGDRKQIGTDGTVQIDGLPTLKTGESEPAPTVYYTIDLTTLTAAGYALADGAQSTVSGTPTSAGINLDFTVTAYTQSITVLQANAQVYSTIDGTDSTSTLPATGTFTFNGPQA